MAVQCSSSLGRRLALGGAGAALALLAGCVAVPAGPYEVGAPVVYPGAVYGAPYYAPGYAYPYGYPYYGRPYYWGPSFSLGLWGGWGGGHRHWRDHGGGRDWHGRPGPGRGPWGGAGGFRGGREGGVRRP